MTERKFIKIGPYTFDIVRGSLMVPHIGFSDDVKYVASYLRVFTCSMRLLVRRSMMMLWRGQRYSFGSTSRIMLIRPGYPVAMRKGWVIYYSAYHKSNFPRKEIDFVLIDDMIYMPSERIAHEAIRLREAATKLEGWETSARLPTPPTANYQKSAALTLEAGAADQHASRQPLANADTSARPTPTVNPQPTAAPPETVPDPVSTAGPKPQSWQDLVARADKRIRKGEVTHDKQRDKSIGVEPELD